tara:strand:- start:17711 stop:17881 length:171 start_codon:yes stop_codon:yes gene_type:complete
MAGLIFREIEDGSKKPAPPIAILFEEVKVFVFLDSCALQATMKIKMQMKIPNLIIK